MEHQRFLRAFRLLNAAQYRHVFDQADLKASDRQLLILARFNGLDHPRVGLIFAKKHVRRANQRNRLKRQIREYFRQHHDTLPNADLVVMARSTVGDLENEQFRVILEKLFLRLHKDGKRFLAKTQDKPSSEATEPSSTQA